MKRCCQNWENDNSLEQKKPKQETYNPHPLLLPPILEKLCECIQPDFHQLKLLRLVCRHWRDATLVMWRTTTLLKIIPDPGHFRKNELSGFLIPDLIEELKSPRMLFKIDTVPFVSYKIQNFEIEVSACFDLPGATEFWDLVGPLMEYLCLDNCQFFANGDIITLLVNKTPNLQVLALKKVKSRPFKSETKIGPQQNPTKFQKLHTLVLVDSNFDNLEDLLPVTPELTTIKGIPTSGIPNDRTYGLNEICDVLCQNDGSLPQLKHIDMIHGGLMAVGEYNRQYGVVGRLPAQNFHLKTLTCDIVTNDPTSFRVLDRPRLDVIEVLESQAKTLETVKLFRLPFCSPFDVFLPGTEMPALIQVNLWGPISPNLQFLRQTPNLKKLHISQTCFDKRVEVEKQLLVEQRRYRQICLYDMVDETDKHLLENLVLLKMESLHVDFEFEAESLKQLSKWMPNLKVLKTHLSSETLQLACILWQDLRELVCLHRSSIDVESIIGANSRHGLVSLKKLEKFQLFHTYTEYPLTDDAIENGFLKMPNLIAVTLCCNNNFTNERKLMLEKHTKTCEIVRHVYGDHDDPNCECCQFLNYTYANDGTDDEGSESDNYSIFSISD